MEEKLYLDFCWVTLHLDYTLTHLRPTQSIGFVSILNLETSIINLLTSAGSSFCVLLALIVLNINYNYIKSIQLKTIFLVSIISSFINSFFTNTIYFISYENWEIGSQFFQYIIGDLIGALIIFYILKFSKKMLI